MIFSVPGGLTLREGMHVVETVYATTNFVSLDLVEFNPSLGSVLEVQRSAKAIKEIIFSCFGYDRGGMPVADQSESDSLKPDKPQELVTT